MAEVVERVARLEERSDGMTAAIADLKVTVSDLDARMQAGFAEIRTELGAVRSEMRGEFAAVRSDSAGIRADMSTQLRWIMGGMGGAVLALLLAMLGAVFAIR